MGGPEYRAALDATLPAGWFAQAVADSDATFQVDLPSVQVWTFTAELARRITQPVLAVRGAESAPRFVEGHELLQQWWPEAEACVVPGATHLLQMVNPRSVAEAVAGFFARHPLAVPA